MTEDQTQPPCNCIACQLNAQMENGAKLFNELSPQSIGFIKSLILAWSECPKLLSYLYPHPTDLAIAIMTTPAVWQTFAAKHGDIADFQIINSEHDKIVALLKELSKTPLVTVQIVSGNSFGKNN